METQRLTRCFSHHQMAVFTHNIVYFPLHLVRLVTKYHQFAVGISRIGRVAVKNNPPGQMEIRVHLQGVIATLSIHHNPVDIIDRITFAQDAVKEHIHQPWPLLIDRQGYRFGRSV